MAYRGLERDKNTTDFPDLVPCVKHNHHDEKDSKRSLITLKAFEQLPAAARIRIAVNGELKVESVFVLHPFVPCRRRIEPYINPTRRSSGSLWYNRQRVA